MELVKKYFISSKTVAVELSTVITDQQEKPKFRELSDVKEVKILNCRKFSTVYETLEIYEKDLKDHDSLLYIKIQIDDNSLQIKSADLHTLTYKCSNKAIVIVILVPQDNLCCVLWKPKELQHFIIFNSHEGCAFNENRNLCEYIGNFLANSLKNGYIGLSNDNPFHQETYTAELHHFSDFRNYNLLLLAAESGNNEIVEILIKLGIPASSNDKKCKAQDLAWNNEHFDVVLTFAKSNMTYPASFNIEECSNELKEFYERTTEIHSAITDGDIEKVKKNVHQNPNVLFFYNAQNESAAKITLRSHKIEIYEFLLANGVFFGPHENTASVMESLKHHLKKRVRELHFKYSKEVHAQHISILMAHTFICHDVPNVKQKLELIQHAYNSLNKNPSIEPILKIIAASKNFQIIFDFNRESINFLDPTVKIDTQGLFYPTYGRMYIGAKQLLNPATQNESIAILGHELCHYAIELGYNNFANPYRSDDRKTKNTFEEISQECKENSGKEDVIDTVYELYPEEMHHAELAVRAVHLYALYDNDPEKMEQARKNFPRFFKFYEHVILKHIKEEIPKIEGRDAAELERKTKIISKLIFYFVIFGIFSIVFVGLVGFLLYTPHYSFNDLSKTDQIKVKNSLVNYKHVRVKFYEIFHNNSMAYEKLTSDHISLMLNGDVLDLDDPYSLYLNDFIVHKWENLPVKLKEKFLNTSFNFQNENVLFGDVYEVILREKQSKSVENEDEFSNTTRSLFNALTTDQITSVFNGQNLTLGKMQENKTNFFVERKFIYEDTKTAYIIYEKSKTLLNVNYLVGFSKFPNFAEKLQSWENEGLLDGYSLINGTVKDIYRLFSSINFNDYVKIIREVENVGYIKDYEQYYTDLNSEVFNFLHRSFEDVYDIAKNEKIFILSSTAGAGKTVAFEQLAMRIKKNFPLLWVSYIELKDNIQYYKLYEKISDVKDMITKILNLDQLNQFEKSIFEDFFDNGNVVLLWNGFDEISPTYKHEVLNTIRMVQHETQNVQFICTRPLYSKELRDFFEIRTYQLLPYNHDDQKEFLTKFYIFGDSRFSSRSDAPDYELKASKTPEIMQNISENDLAQIDKYIEKVKHVIKKLSVKGMTSESLEFTHDFDTPLMLILLAESFVYDENFSSENYYEIFQNFIYKKIKIWSEFGVGKEISNKIIANSQGLSVPEIHQKYALRKELFERLHTIITVNLKKLKIMKKYILPELSWQEISRFGILYINGVNEYEFVHKTFGEFFTAQYLIQSIYYADEDVIHDEAFQRLELFFFVAQNYGQNQLMVTEFLESFIQTQRDTIGDFSPAINELMSTTFKNFLLDLVNPKFSKILKFILDFFRKDHEVLLKILHINEDETLYTAAFNPKYNLRLANPKDLKDIVYNGDYLSKKEFQKFINGKNQKGKILIGMHYFESQYKPKLHHEYKLNFSPSSHWDFVNKISENLTKLEQKEAYIVALNPAFYAASDPSVVGELEKIWKKLVGFLTKIEIKVIIPSIIDQLIRKYPQFEFFDRPLKVIEFLLLKCQEQLSDLEIYEMYSASKILHIGTYNNLVFEVLWNFFENHTNKEQQKSILKQDDNLKYYKKIDYYYFDYNTPLKIIHLALLREKRDYNHEAYGYVKEIYFKLFSKSEIREIITSSSDFWVQYMSRNFDQERLFYYLKEIYKETPGELVKFLKQKVKNTKFHNFEYFDELRTAYKFWNKMEVFTNFTRDFEGA